MKNQESNNVIIHPTTFNPIQRSGLKTIKVKNNEMNNNNQVTPKINQSSFEIASGLAGSDSNGINR